MNRLIPGAPVKWKDQQWILLDIPAVDRVLVQSTKTKSVELAPSEELKLDVPSTSGASGLMGISNDDWNEAWQRFEAIRPLLNRGRRKRSKQEINEVAANLGKDPATIYRWITKFEESKTVSALVRTGRSDRGKSRLSDEVEKIIQHEIESFYLVRERPNVVELWERIALSCRKINLPSPNLSTLRRRINMLQDRLVMSKRYSSKKARETFEPIHGSFPGADVPLAVYQVDHSPLDIILVDDKYRRPIGRGYLTIVTDSCTRMLAGFCVLLDPPGGLAVGLSLAHAILPKSKWLAERGIDASWPNYGVPTKVFADNATEFRGTMLERACREYGILMENRPKGLPNYGGHVERLFRTFMHRMHSLPGSTFSNVQERCDYDSEGRAIMTLAEFEKWFAIFVTKVYHQRRHRGIGYVPPVKLFEQFTLGNSTTKGIGLPEPIQNEYKLRLDFMPFVERTIQEYGVVIDNIHYYADVLRPWIHARDPKNSKLKRKFVFVRDPRDIAEVYFLDPETKIYHAVPYRNLTRPRISVWDLNAALKRISEHPELQPDEDTIFAGLEEMSRVTREAAEKTKTVRRSMQRRSNWREGAATLRAAAQQVPEAVASPPEWQTEIQPFDDIEEAE